MKNLRVEHGFPLGVNPHPNPEKDSVNEKGPVVETSAQSINRKLGSYCQGDKIVSPRYHDGRFLLAGPC
jgi:hypothetical protein